MAGFLDVFTDVSRGNKKIPTAELQPVGILPVVDQGKALIAGFVDDQKAACTVDLPVIIFGDHTRAFKFVDFAFAMGADGTKVLAPKEGHSTKYLYYALRSLQLPEAGYSRHFKFLKEARIPIPPLAEQQRIARILDAADALRAKRRESIAQLDALVQATFLEMFGDPLKNQKKWPLHKIGTLLRVKSGTSLTAKHMAEGGLFPVYGGNGINGYHDEYMFDESKIVLGRVGVYCGVVHLTAPKSWVTDNALYVSETYEEINVVFLETSLRMANLNQYAGRAAQPLISGERIYRVSLQLPPLKLQENFAKVVHRAQAVRVILEAHLTHLDILFTSLQSRAFAGTL